MLSRNFTTIYPAFAMNKFKTRQEMATELGISYPTFYRRCKALGIRLGKGLICPAQQYEIQQNLGAFLGPEKPSNYWPAESAPNLKDFERF